MKWLMAFLQWTAWKMDIWQVYGAFHILTAVFGIAAAVAAGIIAAKKCVNCTKIVYMTVGLILLFSEIYKQLFNYYIVNENRYVLDLIPFQLCSLPMYLCLWIPWIKSEKLRLSLNTFMADFNVLGALMVFVDPSGIFHEYWTLTIHGLMWHLLILFIGVYVGLSGQGAHKNMKGFVCAVPVYAVACGMAVGINVLLHPYGNANMFYVNPYEPSIQIVFRDIAAKFGVAAGNISYVAATAAGAVIVHWGFKSVSEKWYKDTELFSKNSSGQ